MNAVFQRQWSAKIARIRSCDFWRQVSNPPAGNIEIDSRGPGRDDVLVTAKWRIETKPGSPTGPLAIAVRDLQGIAASHFKLDLKAVQRPQAPALCFEISGPQTGLSRWNSEFTLDVRKDRITVTAPDAHALLGASLYISNYWRMRRLAVLPAGRRKIKSLVDIHLGADLWGGFNTTQAWIDGREHDDNYIELARVGVNAMPIMALLEDYIAQAPSRFKLLINPKAQQNRRRLAQLCRQSAQYGVYIFLTGYNPKLAPNHALFRAAPQSKGALQFNSFRTLCSSDDYTRKFLADSWASLFAQIPELGGMLTLVGGEGFYHCYMRSEDHAADCPRCSKANPSRVVAQLVNDTAAAVRNANSDARLVAWTYSASHWSNDRDHVEFINRLNTKNVIYQTEIDKECIDWRKEGYAKYCWDYSASVTSPGERSGAQRKLCRKRGLGFGYKLQINTSIECLSVPYLPVLNNRLATWRNCMKVKPQAVQSRWLFDGSSKSPAEELGYWAMWGRGTEFEDLGTVLKSIALRDYGAAAAKYVLKAWSAFSEAMRHHPSLDYYVGSYFIGPGQPLVLRPAKPRDPGWEVVLKQFEMPAQRLSREFFGHFYWLWEADATSDAKEFETRRPLFYSSPGFRAIVRRGKNAGQDIAVSELKSMARLWENGCEQLKRAKPLVDAKCRKRFDQLWILAEHLKYTWQSAANVEEFLRTRDSFVEFTRNYSLCRGHRKDNARDFEKMRRLALDELTIAQADLELVRSVDFLDLGLRLDMGTSSTANILRAKIRQVRRLIDVELPLIKKWL